jgi:hypothetical protein
MFGGSSGSSGSSGNVVRETELEAVLSLQYRLCSVSHLHVLQHVAVYPHVYEVRYVCVCLSRAVSTCSIERVLCALECLLFHRGKH